MMFDDFVDHTDRYRAFIEELLDADSEGRFDEVFNRAYGMGTYTINEFIDVYAMVDSDCIDFYKNQDTSEEALKMDALRLRILSSLSEANTAEIAFELAACFFEHFTKGTQKMDESESAKESLTRIFKCIASTGSWSEFFAGLEPVFHTYYAEFSDQIGFDCSRLAGITCNPERGKQIIENENCHPSFRQAYLERDL